MLKDQQHVNNIGEILLFYSVFCCEFFSLRRFGDALFAPNYGCYDLIVDIFISATRLVLASS